MLTEYINWNGERKTWDPDTAVNYFLIVDRQVIAEDGRYLSHGAMFHGTSAKEVRRNLLDWIFQNPDFVADWRKAGAKIVKAPCAFDARETHVVVEVL